MDSSARFHGGTWRRYKIGQAQFTKWLKETADQLSPTASAAGGPASPSRSQKKAQKAASKAGVDDDVAVHWRELEILASSIVEHAKPIDIPVAPINILRDVISLRKRSAKFFHRSVGGDDETAREKNATHEHIIKVLERVLGKFEALMAKATKPAEAKFASGIKMDLADLNNMFEHLELQTTPADGDAISDTENQVENSIPTKKSTREPEKGGKKLQKVSKPKKQQMQQLQPQEPQDDFWLDIPEFDLDSNDGDNEFDYCMMIYCFFEDFNIIRSYICERWCDYFYDEESISLNTLAVITNAAFEIFHQMEHDLLLDMRRMGIRNRVFASYEYMMMELFAKFGLEHIDYDSDKNLSREEIDARIWTHEWDWLASPAFSTVRRILDNVPPGQTLLVRKADMTPPVYGVMDPDDLARFKETVINELLLDVFSVKALKTNNMAPAVLPAESELLLGFQGALRKRDFASAFIFSLHLYCDIRYIMEDKVSHAFEQLEETAQLADESLRLASMRSGGPRSSLRWSIRERQKEVERFMLLDVVQEDKIPRFKDAGLEAEDIEMFSLLKNEPIWAGLLDFRAKLVMNELGHEFINRSFIVETAAYLYAAARAVSEQYGDEQEFPLWNDMETFLDSFVDESALLKGIYDSSDDPAKIIKNLKAIMPADVLDPKPDNCPLDEGSDRHDEFKNAVRVRQLLSKRYTSSDGKNPFFMEYMQDLVRERMGHVVEKLRPEDDTSMVLRDISTDKYGGQPHSHSLGQLPKEQREQSLKRLELKQKHQRRKVMLAQLSPIQQLQFLANIVEEQHEDLLALDSMALFHTSWCLVYAVAMTHQQWLNDECGITVNPTRSFVERAAIVPVVIGDHLTGDMDGDKKLLRRLARDVRMVLEKDEGTLCGPLAYESDLIEDRTRREHTNNQ